MNHQPNTFALRGHVRWLRNLNARLVFVGSARTGFSLLELLLVLAIMVAALAIAVPTYDSLLTERRLQKSTDTLQLELQRARVKAITTGQAQVFRFEVGGGGYSVQPWLSGGDDLNAGPGATVLTQSGQAVETSSQSGGMANVADTSEFEKKLDEDITFSSPSFASDVRTAATQAQSGIISGASNWSDPILFYSDGSSTTTEVIIKDARGRRRSLQLRGLTGECRVLELTSIAM